MPGSGNAGCRQVDGDRKSGQYPVVSPEWPVLTEPGIHIDENHFLIVIEGNQYLADFCDSQTRT